MTPAEREELARWAESIMRLVEHQGVGVPSDLDALKRIAAALREPVGEAQQAVNPNVVSVAADMLRDVAADLDRAVRAASSAQPASAEPCASCSEQLVTIADLRAEVTRLRETLRMSPSELGGLVRERDRLRDLRLRTRAESAEAEVALMRGTTIRVGDGPTVTLGAIIDRAKGKP